MVTYSGHTYTNGHVPPAVLGRLDPPGGNGIGRDQDAHLRADAAAAWNRARADVEARTGIVLTVRGWNRTLAEQVRFFHAAYQPQRTGGTDPRVYQGVRYVRRPGKAAAAIPGNSNHGWGLAVDVTDFGAVGQFDYPRRNKAFPILAEHGWTDTEGRKADTNEPWHLVYDPARDQHVPAPTAPTTSTTPTIAQEDDMPIIIRHPSGAAYVLAGGRAIGLTTADDIRALQKAGVGVADVTPDLYARIAGNLGGVKL